MIQGGGAACSRNQMLIDEQIVSHYESKYILCESKYESNDCVSSFVTKSCTIFYYVKLILRVVLCNFKYNA